MLPLLRQSRRLLASIARQLDGDAAHLDDFVIGDRVRSAIADCVEERRDARLLALVLTPEVHRPEPLPAVAGERTEVVEPQDLAARECLQPLFREGFVAICEVMDCA